MTPPPVRPAKRSWPLLTLAATSFVPVFGFFLGAAAVTWGLLSDRPRAKHAVVIGVVGFPTRMININDLSAGLFRQQPYQYHPSPNRQTYTLFATGPDGAPGTSDDIYPSPPDTTSAPSDP